MENSFKAAAPGRLDVMGGIADYSGSLVLQKPIAQQTHVEISLRKDYLCNITSRLSTGEALNVEIDYRYFLRDGEVDYAFAQQAFRSNSNNSWIAYILGCALALQKEKGIHFQGATIHLQSDVPPGKGVASSAALEVATMQAMGKALGASFSGTELPVLAQRVENLVVGAPCGLMDQLTSCLGRPGTVLPIICQPDQVLEAIEIPTDVYFIGVDSGIRHQVAGATYGDVRCAAFMGYTIIALSLGISPRDILNAKHQTDTTLPFNGYLSNISLEKFEKTFLNLLPETINGNDFLKQFGGTIDPHTLVDNHKTYSVKNCASHPVYENHRVQDFREWLVQLNTSPEPVKRKQLTMKMGGHMLASHQSYSRCGLGTKRTDEIVSLALGRAGICGARITGGGNGGTVCLMAVGNEGMENVKSLHLELCDTYGEKLGLFY